LKLLLWCIPWLVACAPENSSPLVQSSAAVVFEGARLITGNESAPIENSVFVVEDGKFTQVGAAGDLTPPAGAQRVDLSGKTVMPAIIDLHVHLGYLDVMGMTNSPANFSRQNLVDHLARLAYYGVSAGLSMGLDRGDLPYEVRAETLPGVARLLTAGAGIARPNASTGNADRRDVAYGIDTEAAARNSRVGAWIS